MRWLCLALLFVTTSCNMNYGGDAKYTDYGKERPTVEVVPVIDGVQTNFAWNLSNELTNNVRDRLKASGNMIVATQYGANPKAPNFSRAQLTAPDMAFAKDYKGVSFVLVTELTKHEVTPYDRSMTIRPVYPAGGECTEVIQIAVNLRLIDIRDGHPRIVLQRTLPSNHLVPKGEELAATDYAEIQPGDQRYLATPIGRAHARLARDIAQQVEQYIGLTR